MSSASSRPQAAGDPAGAIAPAGAQRSILGRMAGVRELGIFLVILLVAVILSVTTRAFLTPQNLSAVAIGLVTDGLIAIGMTLVLIMAGVDLSVGSVLALTGMVVAKLLAADLGLAPALLISLFVAAIVGAVNGLVISVVGVNPLITTLGMMGIAASMTLVVSGGYPVAGLPEAFLYLGQGRVWGIPVTVIFLIVVAIIADLLLRRARWLRLVYYIGGNERAALLAGVPVRTVRVAVYIFVAIMAGIAGVIATARLGSAFPLAGRGAELRVISACVIGGCSLAGGEGTVLGALLGVLLMALISNGLVLLNVSVNWQGIVTGAILIGAVTFDTLSRRSRA